ncbi:kinase-like protein [Hesseltinella vesiculosa]|uniref:Kinase-like protein n=1 Tax=Hesseltinella vesiculosa TaxID=101127 RepID=A0A1X2G7X6_9FUNG|nr:kinase-like protein [Hesseltinella vesiculosa]
MEGDLDSDASIDNVPIQEASRVTRRYPVKVPFLSSFHKKPQQSRSSSQDSSSTASSTPFYSAVVEPAMSLGQQYPPKPKAFRKVCRGEHRLLPSLSSTITNPQKNLLKQMTLHILSTFENLNPEYRYNAASRPQRVLTKPSKEAKNDGFDNEDCDYILKVNDILGEEKGHQYRVIDLLGQGTFGQVVKCHWIGTEEYVSVKVIKNKTAYRAQSRMEVEILKQLKHKLSNSSERHILDLKHTFMHKNHFCLVFELLSFNLYELIKQNLFRGLSLNLVRVFTLQLLDTLTLLKDAKIIHCDLKPENILLTSFESPTIKVIDFGSACHEANRIYNYIQSRFYRSPEILLGLQYSGAIDMWSLGCIVAELFIGIPLFPGNSEYNQLRRIVDMLGAPPNELLENATNTHLYFNKIDNGKGKCAFEVKSMDQYSTEQKKVELPGKKYYVQSTLPELILEAKSTPQASPENKKYDLERRHALIDFLYGLLELNPLKRWTPQQARYHPFVTGEPFVEPYDPNQLRLSSVSTLTSQQHPHRSSITDDTLVPSASTTNTPHTLNGDQSSSQDTVQSLEMAAASLTMPQNSIFLPAAMASRRLRQRAQSMNTLTVPIQLQGIVQDIEANPVQEHRMRHESQPPPQEHTRQPHPAQQSSQLQQPQSILHNPKPAPSSSSSLSSWYRHRQSRSQGDLAGLLSPEKNSGSASANPPADPNPSGTAGQRKVKIADMVRIGAPSHGRQPSQPSARHLGNQNLLPHPAHPTQDSQDRRDHKSKTDWLMDASSLSTLHTGRNKGSKARFSHEGEAAGGLLMMRNAKPEPSTSTPSTATTGVRMMNVFKRRSLLGGA